MSGDVVFVPGLLCTGDLFAAQMAALAPGWRAHVANHRDDGSMQEIAARLLREAPPRFVLAGLSMGGYIASEVIRQEPDRVAGVVLIDTSARADRPEQSQDRERLIALAHESGIDPVVTQLLDKMIAAERIDDAALVERIRQMARETGVAGFERQMRAIMARTPAFERLAQVRCPALVICGAQDTLTPPKLAYEIADAIDGARVEIIEGSGHLATMEQPEAVTAVLNRFLEEIGSQ